MKFITFCSIIVVASKLVESYLSICDKEYCLWTDEQIVYLNNLQEARDRCSNGWLLEVYGPSVWALVAQIVSTQNVQSNKVILNMEKHSNWWIWNDNTDAKISIASQDDNPVPLAGSLYYQIYRIGAYAILYMETELNTQLSQICSKKILKKEDCSLSNSWMVNDTCYFVLNNAATWFDANNYCISSGGTLAVFDDSNGVNVTVLFQKNLERYWVGLSRNTWKWSHGDAVVTLNRWLPKYLPYRECSYLKMFERGYFWQISSCNGSFVIICMTYANLFLSNTSLTPTSREMKNSLPAGTTVETAFPYTSLSGELQNNNHQLVAFVIGWILAGIFLLCLFVVIPILWRRPQNIFKAQTLQRPDMTTSVEQSNFRTTMHAYDNYISPNMDDAKRETETRMYEQLEN